MLGSRIRLGYRRYRGGLTKKWAGAVYLCGQEPNMGGGVGGITVVLAYVCRTTNLAFSLPQLLDRELRSLPRAGCAACSNPFLTR